MPDGVIGHPVVAGWLRERFQELADRAGEMADAYGSVAPEDPAGVDAFREVADFFREMGGDPAPENEDDG